jgi:hypothetical protein
MVKEEHQDKQLGKSTRVPGLRSDSTVIEKHQDKRLGNSTGITVPRSDRKREADALVKT